MSDIINHAVVVLDRHKNEPRDTPGRSFFGTHLGVVSRGRTFRDSVMRLEKKLEANGIKY